MAKIMAKKKDLERGVFPVAPGKMLEPDFWRGRGRYSKTATKQKTAKATLALPNNGEKHIDEKGNDYTTKRQRLEKWIKDQGYGDLGRCPRWPNPKSAAGGVHAGRAYP